MGVKEIINWKDHHHKGESSATPATTEPPFHRDDASSVDDGVLEKERIVPLTKKQKVKRHCGRFKWWYLLGLVIFLAIFLPILFEVIVPAIIKNVVDDQELPIISGSMVFTDSDRIVMSLNTSLDTPLAVKIDPVGLRLYSPQVKGEKEDKDKSPFVTVQMPKQHIDGKTTVPIPEQEAMVQDNTQLVTWFNNFFDSEYADLRVKAKPLVAHLGKLKYKVGLDKTIRVQGLNSLKGFGVNDMSFTLPADPDTGNNMKGTLLIPNAGVLTLNMGNVSFNMWCGDLNLGIVTSNNLILKPGNNTPSFEGQLYLDQLVPNLSAILDAQKGALANGVIELNATGNSTIYQGRRVTYIESVLNSKKLPVQIPAITLVTELLSGLLSSGSDGSGSKLLDSLGQVAGNTTLFNKMLSNFDGDSGSDSNETTTGDAKVKRGTTKSPVRTIRTSLFRLGLRGLKGGK